jgi:hypothetical protein
MIIYQSNLRASLYALSIAVLLFFAAAPIRAQHEKHDMSTMPGMKKPKAKPKSKPRPATARRRQPTPAKPKQTEANEADDMDASVPAVTAPAPSETSQPAPAPADVHKHMNTPSEAPAPSTAPAPLTVQPQPAAPAHRHDNMEMSAPTGNAQPSGASNPTPGMETHEMGGMTMDPNSLMVMSGEQMKISIGPGTLNSLQMGQMGSGSSWQPATTPMYMYTKVSGKWVVFVHADAKIGVNAQGGARGVTKFESSNWIMPMAFRRVGKGTLQLRGMFSFERSFSRQVRRTKANP